MANLISLDAEQAPLASGDEMTPSLEYTLDDPPPPPGDDDTERDQPTPSSEDKSNLMFDDPPPPPSADAEIMQPMQSMQPIKPIQPIQPIPFNKERSPEFENPSAPPVVEEEYEPKPSNENREDKQQSPTESQPPVQSVIEDFKPSAIVMPTQMTNPDKETIPESKQPIYEEVSDNPDNKPEHHEMKETKNNPGDDPKEQNAKEHKDEKDEKKESEKKDEKKSKEEKGKDVDASKEVEEGKEADSESMDRVDLRIPPPGAPMPKHRSRCVACGCPRICCVRNFIFVWVVIFILIQAGPLAVLILDLLSINVEGTTISRYIAEWNMQPVVCKVANLDKSDWPSCECGYRWKDNCTAPIKEYGCMEVTVNIFTYERRNGAFAKKVPLWKSDREYLLDTSEPWCYNLDICSIDSTKPWYEYGNETKKDYDNFFERLSYKQDPFVCYYKKKNDGKYVAIKDRNTSFWDLLLWFILPSAGILICWLAIFIALCWYCCPRNRSQDQGGKKHNGGYQEVDNVEEASGDHDADAMKENLVLDDAGEHMYAGENMQAGKWPMSGPAAACM